MSDTPTNEELKELIVHLLAKDRVHEARWRVLAATVEANMPSLGVRIPPTGIIAAMQPEIRRDLEQTLIEFESHHPGMAARISALIDEMYPDKI